MLIYPQFVSNQNNRFLVAFLLFGSLSIAQIPANDQVLNQFPNRGISINIMANDDTGGLPPGNVRLVAPAGSLNNYADGQGDVNQYLMPSEGSWHYNQLTGILTFLPIKGYVGNPTQLTYRYRRSDNTVSSTAVVTVSIICGATDTDLDGIFDTCDSDDDNDGISNENECYIPINTEEFSGTFGVITGTNRNLVQPPSTGYTYGGVGVNALNAEARYVVTSYSNSNNIHSSNQHWQHLRGHTNGSDNDAYLAVNGSTSQSVFYDQDFATGSIQPNTNYRISLWAIDAVTDLNLSSGPANIEIRIIGNPGAVLIASASTGDIYPNRKPIGSDLNPADWSQAATIFNSGNYNNYRLEVRNLSVESRGNDFAIDDINLSLANCIDTDNDGIINSIDLDSDGDGCPDAIEGDENVLKTHLNSNGNINTTSYGGVDEGGIPNLVNKGGLADIGGDFWQGVGNSRNTTTNSCQCFKNAVVNGIVLDTNVGISSLRIDNVSGWPQVRKGAWIALESKTKGFVVNRIPVTSEIINIINPIEGMIIYDDQADCLKIYSSIDYGATFGWYCFSNPACPEIN